MRKLCLSASCYRFGALFALYIIWGSTYFVIAVGVASWPPLMMAAFDSLCRRYFIAGLAAATGHKLPARRPLLNAALIGLLLLAVGNGMVTVRRTSARSFRHRGGDGRHRAPVHLCFSRLFGIKTRKLEWVGIAIGLAGIIMLNSGGNLSGNPMGRC